jgi:hypothetical protein
VHVYTLSLCLEPLHAGARVSRPQHPCQVYTDKFWVCSSMKKVAESQNHQAVIFQDLKVLHLCVTSSFSSLNSLLYICLVRRETLHSKLLSVLHQVNFTKLCQCHMAHADSEGFDPGNKYIFS